MAMSVCYRAYPDQIIWTEFDNISAVFDRHSGATHLIIPDQRHIYACAAQMPLTIEALLDRLIDEFDHEADNNDSIREILAVRVDELIGLGLLRPVL